MRDVWWIVLAVAPEKSLAASPLGKEQVGGPHKTFILSDGSARRLPVPSAITVIYTASLVLLIVIVCLKLRLHLPRFDIHLPQALHYSLLEHISSFLASDAWSFSLGPKIQSLVSRLLFLLCSRRSKAWNTWR